MVEKETKDKIAYVDFKTISKEKAKKHSLDAPMHTNPVMNKLFKFVHTKMSDKKEDYKSFTDFKPEDLV